jgi:hypothetical protein
MTYARLTGEEKAAALQVLSLGGSIITLSGRWRSVAIERPSPCITLRFGPLQHPPRAKQTTRAGNDLAGLRPVMAEAADHASRLVRQMLRQKDLALACGGRLGGIGRRADRDNELMEAALRRTLTESAAHGF